MNSDEAKKIGAALLAAHAALASLMRQASESEPLEDALDIAGAYAAVDALREAFIELGSE